MGGHAMSVRCIALGKQHNFGAVLGSVLISQDWTNIIILFIRQRYVYNVSDPVILSASKHHGKKNRIRLHQTAFVNTHSLCLDPQHFFIESGRSVLIKKKTRQYYWIFWPRKSPDQLWQAKLPLNIRLGLENNMWLICGLVGNNLWSISKTTCGSAEWENVGRPVSFGRCPTS